jgi:hypothetical protein
MVDENKRRFLKLLAGGIAGLSIPMSIYEGAIIPEIERRFIKELEYWMNEYKLADEKLKELQSKYESSNNTLTNLKQFENELDNQIKLYSQKKDEAINKIKETINKYEILFGKEASFEKNAVKILEDLKIKGDKLLKSYKYFPAIVDLHWKPIRVINDKIYNINVSFEVISPLNTLKEVEVRLIPVEYGYFITKYGMREEDYDKVFPKEEVKSVKIEPKKLEREMFSVDFKDLKGGKEYIINARVKDVAGNEKTAEIKTYYIRQFENLGKELYEKGIIVGGSYYLWWGPEYWVHNSPLTLQPLLGWYDSTDQIVVSKQIDIFTGHGINVFFISWSGRSYENTYYHDRRLRDIFLHNSLVSDVRFAFLYETHGRLVKESDGLVDLNNANNKENFIGDFEYLAKNYFSHPSYLKIRGKPAVYIYGSTVFTLKTKDVGKILNEMRNRVKNVSNYDIYLISSEVSKWFDPNEPKTKERLVLFECNSDWAAQYGGVIEVDKDFMDNYDENVLKVYKKYREVLEKLGRDFMPSVIPGFRDTRKWSYTTPHIIVERDVERFTKRLKDALSTTLPHLVLIRFDTLNDHHENTQIEPTTKEGYGFLENISGVLKNFLKSYKK